MIIEKLQVNDVFDFIDYRGQSPDKRETGIPLLTAKNIKQGYINEEPREYLAETQYLKWTSRGIPKAGDILFTTEAPLGNIALMPEYERVVVAQRVICLSPKLPCDTSYYKWYMLSNIFQGELYKRATGSTAKGIRSKELALIEIHYPPLETQKKIATILDAANEYRQHTKTLIEKYDQLAQSLFLDMFGDPVTNPKGLKVVKLADVTIRITDGVHAKPNYTESGVPFISVKDITTGLLKFDNCKFISKEDHLKFTKRCCPEYLDILYTKVGATYGRPAIIDTKNEFSIYVSVALIKPDHSKINPYFLKDALENPAVKRQADRSIKGIGVPDLHLNMIKEFLIPLPEFSLQKQFADRIGDIEKQKALAQTSLQKAEDLFNSLLQRAFKGELV